MDSSDSGAFERAFKRVSGAFGKVWRAGEFQPTKDAYFDGLRHLSIETVEAAAERGIRTRKRFPLVVDWIADVTPAAATTTTPDVRWMTTAECDELARAAATRYQDDPCPCADCVAAGVDHHPLRFVPDDEPAFNPRRNKVELVGHWAHGVELLRWYDARARCIASVRSSRGLAAIARSSATLGRVLHLVEREPGEDDE